MHTLLLVRSGIALGSQMDVARNWKPWAGVTAASAAALSAAWLWWVPAQIADVAHARASRLGLRAEFGDVSLGLGSVRFHESELLTVGPGLKASLRSVEASFSSFDAVLAGSPDRFVVEGGQIDLDVEGSGLRETLDRLANVSCRGASPSIPTNQSCETYSFASQWGRLTT